MNNGDYNEKRQKPEKTGDDKRETRPWEIQGKLEVPDTRERKDGPGGN